MKSLWTIAGACAASLALCGCAAREVTPVAMSQSGDEGLNCNELAKQLAANESDIKVFIAKDKRVADNNVAKNVAGAVIPGVGILLIASTDLSNSEQIQARALIDRNQQLHYLEKQKGCNQ